MKRHNTSLQKYSIHIFIFRKGRNWCKCETETGRRRQTEDSEDFYTDLLFLATFSFHIQKHFFCFSVGEGALPLLDTRRPLSVTLCLCDWPSAAVWRGYLCIYSFPTPTRSYCQLTWPASGCQSTWAAYIHESLSSCLHSWNMVDLSKVNM